MSLPTCLYSTCKLCAHWGQKRMLDAAELASQMIVTTMWLLGIEPRPSATFKMEVIGNRNLLSLRSESPMLRLHTLDQQRLIPKWPALVTSLTEDAQPSPKPKPLKCQLKIIVVIIIKMRRPQPEPLVAWSIFIPIRNTINSQLQATKGPMLWSNFMDLQAARG